MDCSDEVELKVGIQRLGGMLSAGEEETYTTDTSGSVSVDLNKEHLPGDESGNIVLVAKVDDHEQFGNLLFDISVPWGVPTAVDQNFFKQEHFVHFAIQDFIWLLFMAYSIVIEFGVHFHLIFQIVKSKIGDAHCHLVIPVIQVTR
jgi:long-subunit fatty acid transport protein